MHKWRCRTIESQRITDTQDFNEFTVPSFKDLGVLQGSEWAREIACKVFWRQKRKLAQRLDGSLQLTIWVQDSPRTYTCVLGQTSAPWHCTTSRKLRVSRRDQFWRQKQADGDRCTGNRTPRYTFVKDCHETWTERFELDGIPKFRHQNAIRQKNA